MILNIELENYQEYIDAKRELEEWEEKHRALLDNPDCKPEEIQKSYDNRPQEAMEKLTFKGFNALVERATAQYVEALAGDYDKFIADAKRVIDAYALADFFVTTGYFKEQLRKFRSGEADIYDLAPKKPDEPDYTQDEIDFFIHGLEINSEENYQNLVYNICMHLIAPLKAAARYGFDTNELISYITAKGIMLYPDKGHEEEQKEYTGKVVNHILVNLPVKEELYARPEEEPTEKRTYRTRSRAEGADSIPEWLAQITAPGYGFGLTPHQEKQAKAYLEPLNPEAAKNLRFNSETGKLFFEGSIKAISEVQLENIRTKETITQLNLPLLRSIYSIFLNRFQKTGENRETLNVYLPDFAEFLGYGRNISSEQIKWFVSQASMFQSVAGCIETPYGKSMYAVMVFLSYDAEKNMLSISSPYLSRLIKEVYNTSIVRDEKKNPKLKPDGTPQLKASYSYLMKPSIGSVKNTAAVETVAIILQVIEQAGNNTPHISLQTLIDRNEALKAQLENTPDNNKSRVISRHFTKAWELLSLETHLEETYKDIKLPRPYRKEDIPSLKDLRKNRVYEFPHNGKKKT